MSFTLEYKAKPQPIETLPDHQVALVEVKVAPTAYKQIMAIKIDGVLKQYHGGLPIEEPVEWWLPMNESA